MANLSPLEGGLCGKPPAIQFNHYAPFTPAEASRRLFRASRDRRRDAGATRFVEAKKEAKKGSELFNSDGPSRALSPDWKPSVNQQ